MKHLSPHRLAAALCCVALAVLLASCGADHDDYTTRAVVVIDVPDSVRVERMQGTATFTNLNSRQRTMASTFSGTSIQVELLRGAYSIDVEGSLRYTDALGAAHAGTFRAATSYAEVLDHPAEIHLSLILM